MTKIPLTIGRTARMAEAVDLMRAHKISELPVIDADGRPVGLLDITDLIGAEAAAEPGGRQDRRSRSGSRERVRPHARHLPATGSPASSCCCSTWTAS